MMHIAAAFQKPVVCIWGNTIPEFGFEPYKTAHFNLEVKNLECRPCSRTGYDACPKQHFRCMQNQNLQHPELWQFIRKALEN
jgi:ADP-heptose:LPS heptosyltransferase